MTTFFPASGAFGLISAAGVSRAYFEPVIIVAPAAATIMKEKVMKKNSNVIKVKKEKNFSPIWYVLGIGSIIVILLFLISSIINIGERFRSLNTDSFKLGTYLEILFYILIAVILFFTVINPIRIILFSPSLSVITTLDDSEKHKYNHLYVKVAKNIVKNNDLQELDKKLLTEYKNITELKINLQMVFESSIKNELNNIIVKSAKTVMISTAISQNARVDMFTVYGVNLNLIKQLVQKCGFRPSMKNLSKLSIKVMSTALIADGLEQLNLDDVLPQSALAPLNEVPFVKPVISSITQGIANGLLTLRIGMVTRKYLFRDGEEITRESIRKSAWKDSMKLLPKIVADTFTFIPKKIVNLFKKKDKDNKSETPTSEVLELE